MNKDVTIEEDVKERIKPCPVCGKQPKVKRDIGYEISGFGAWCIIQCKPLLGKAHLKRENLRGNVHINVQSKDGIRRR